MKNNTWEIFLKYPKWISWWYSELEDNPDNLYYFKTGGLVTAQDKVKRIRPNIDDIVRFLIQNEIEIRLVTRQFDDGVKWLCEIRNEDKSFITKRTGKTPTQIIEYITLEYLKKVP